MEEQKLDPAIAALLKNTQKNKPSQNMPSLKNVEGKIEENKTSVKKNKPVSGVPVVDLSIKEFSPVTKFLNDKPSQIFYDNSYYKKALSGEGDAAKRLHTVLTQYLKCHDPKDKTVYRQRLYTSWWDYINALAPKMSSASMNIEKKMVMRFGVLLPSLFTTEQKELFSKVIFENNTGEPVFYVDEWFKEICKGTLSLSVTDEVRPKAKSGSDKNIAEQHRLLQLKTKNDGRLQHAGNNLSQKETQRAMQESELRSRVDLLFEHEPILGLSPHKASYTEMQRKLFSEINVKLKELVKTDKELAACLKEFQEAKSIEENLEANPDFSEASVAEVDKNDIQTEFQTVRQMAKMTVGRQGNQFPILTREFYHCLPKGTGFRENIIDIMAWIESQDPGVFCRIHKNVPNRIVPFVLLVPTYGDTGFCWEPFNRYDRIMSRGRIIIPMYPRDLKIAVLTAVADLRWQVAKEKASYYWMEEGLTGQYYQWFSQQKLKGDVKAYFIQDYILWMTKEATGIQRVDKEVRGIFWRNMPYPKELKEKLRLRSLVYDELCRKDLNREMSDGY